MLKLYYAYPPHLLSSCLLLLFFIAKYVSFKCRCSDRGRQKTTGIAKKPEGQRWTTKLNLIDPGTRRRKEMTNLARCPAVYGRLRSLRSLHLVYPRNSPAARKSVRVCGWTGLTKFVAEVKINDIYIIYQWKLPKLYFFFSIVEDTFRIRLIVLVVLDVQDSFDSPRMPKTCLNNGCLQLGSERTV